jgi:hypothetical protein
LSFILLLAVIAFYAVVWSRVGRDPNKDIIVPVGHLRARNALHKALDKQHHPALFVRNGTQFSHGVLLSIASYLMLAVDVGLSAVPGMLIVLMYAAAVAAVFASTLHAWFARIPRMRFNFARAIGAIILMVLIGLFGLLVWGFACLFVSMSGSFVVAALVLCNAIFYRLLRAPTLAGRRVMDHIEGLRLYLSVAEKDRYRMEGEPVASTELHKRLLPYAMALDVEKSWTDKFTDIIDDAT